MPPVCTPYRWAPSIVYAISAEDNIFLDFYCGFPESLDTDVFTRVFTLQRHKVPLQPACSTKKGAPVQV